MLPFPMTALPKNITLHPTAGTGLFVPTYPTTSIARFCIYLPCLLFMFIHSFLHSRFSLFTFEKIKRFSSSLLIMRKEKESTCISVDITQAYPQPTLLASYSTLLEAWLKPLVQFWWTPCETWIFSPRKKCLSYNRTQHNWDKSRFGPFLKLLV